MRGRGIAVLAAFAAVIAATPAADAKFKVSLAFRPAQPLAGHVVRATLRTEIVLPKWQEMRFVAVGRWRRQSGQAVLYARLVRIGPRVFRASLRFPHAGHWRVQVVVEPGSASLPPGEWQVRVVRRS